MIFLASDHAGYTTKDLVSKYLTKKEQKFADLGTNSTDSVDYVDYAKKLVQKMYKKEGSIGILICGSGIGMSIAANRFKGIRAALCRGKRDALMARKHNNANVLVLGSRTCMCKIKKIIDIFLATEFDGGRHQRRIEKLDE